jgi:signal transduction histidine kinase
LAHEIGNPISVVQGYLGLLQQDDLTGMERKDFALRSENELQRINRLIQQLLDFSRVNSFRQENVSIHTVLQAVVEMVTCQPFMSGIDVRCDFAAGSDIVRGTADQLQQVFLNCLLNAADAVAAADGNIKEITIQTSIIKDDPTPDRQNFIRISIVDTGVGIDAKDQANIFDPFFTTKEPGKGTGLGLSVAFSIVESCKGSMKVESVLGKGTTVLVTLPLDLETVEQVANG